MSNSNTASAVNSGFFSLMFLIFLTLKLAEIGSVATWSWWWVTAPLWGPVAFCLAIALVTLVIGLVILGITKIMDVSQQNKNRTSRRLNRKR